MKERTITRTIITNTVTVFGADFAERTFATRTKDICGKLNPEDKIGILSKFKTDRFAPSEIESITTQTVKRYMTEEFFIMNSKVFNDVSEIKEDRVITRTINKNRIQVFGADFSDYTFHSVEKEIGGNLDEIEDKEYIFYLFKTDTFIPYQISEFSTESQKRYMSEEFFIQNSKIVEE